MHCILAREIDGGSSSSMHLNYLPKLSAVLVYRLSYSPVMHMRIRGIPLSELYKSRLDQTPATLEKIREQIMHEVEKTERNYLVIGKLMDTTYALCRQDIVGAVVAPRVRDVVDRWPALLMESQVVAEFHRINNVNLRTQFYRHTPRLITLFRDKAIKTGKIAEELAKLMRIYDIQEQRDVNTRRALVLHALPVYLHEDASTLFRTCDSANGPDLTDTPVALLTVVTDDTTDSALFSPESICIVVEDEILVNGHTNLADSFLLLFGYIYALDLQYPKKLELTFTFIQKVVMCLEDNKPLKGRLLMLKNALFNERITQNGLLVELSIEEVFLCFLFFFPNHLALLLQI
ncbi:NLR family CARD domain-containing protein 3 [Sarotherodon galilaeus]